MERTILNPIKTLKTIFPEVFCFYHKRAISTDHRLSNFIETLPLKMPFKNKTDILEVRDYSQGRSGINPTKGMPPQQKPGIFKLYLWAPTFIGIDSFILSHEIPESPPIDSDVCHKYQGKGRNF